MSYRTLALSIATLSCMQVASAQAQSVYVAGQSGEEASDKGLKC
jgi:hypothetical protein